jgi:DNA-directed RNA polymerase specialized sigma subunit
MTDLKGDDITCWKEWKRTGDPAVLQRLLDRMSGIIGREVNRWASGLSRSLLDAEAKRLAVMAFRDYDAGRGVALSTFVASRLPKLSRLVYANQNAARMSETKTLLFRSFHAAKTELRDTHGREPTAIELADHLGWSPAKVEDLERQYDRKEYVESEEHPDTADTGDDFFVDFIYHGLSPLQQKVFEYASGYRGAPRLQGKEIMQRLDITQGQLSHQKSLIVSAIEQARGARG